MTKPRLASVYARNRDFVVESSSWTTSGLRIGTEPIEVLPNDVAPSSLGAACRGALSACREGIAHPTDWKAKLSPLLVRANIRSWNAMQKSAKLCQVEALERHLKIVPSKNGGTSGPDKGYHPIADRAITLPLDCSDEELGAAVLNALTSCT